MAITLRDQKKRTPRAEKVLQGRSVSKGAAIGEAVCLYGVKRQFYRIKIKNNEVEREVKRFHAAVRLARLRLKKISAPAGDVSTLSGGILDVQFLLLEDRSLIDKVEYLIRTKKVNAEWAVKEVSDKYLEAYKAIQDDYLKGRYIDLEDVTERLMGALDGGVQNPLSFSAGTIVVAKEIMPSTMVEILNSDVRGIVTESGGWTSHSFILAREHGLPSVTGIKNVLKQIRNGVALAVDGDRGTVTIEPANKKIKAHSPRPTSSGERVATSTPLEFRTLDGKKINIRVNCDAAAHYREAKQLGARGIGLFRSEFLVNRERGFPSEKAQLREYAAIASEVGVEGVSIRTFDVDVSHALDEEREKNPALGLRAIRLGLANEKIFRTQIRALLQASYKTHLNILLPMISDVAEIRRAKKVIAEEKKALARKGLKAGKPKIGAMVEVPSAVLMADEISAEVDFLSLGTNDLVQYLLAVDRDNENVADWFRTLHPAVLRSVKYVINAGKKNKIPVVVCGEMSGSPVYSVILIGLGADELSMSVTALPRVIEIIRGISAKDAAGLTKDLLKSSSADEAEALVRREFVRKWPHLFDLKTLPQGPAKKSRRR